MKTKKSPFKTIHINVSGGIVDIGRVPQNIRVVVKDEDLKNIGQKSTSIYEGKIDPKVSTVNVIEFLGPNTTGITSLKSFSDTKEGNFEAEKLFCSLLEKINVTDLQSIRQALEDGYYENSDGSYTVLLTHST